ncbi:hypothetical protein N9544_00325 [Flavobacteriales bacterium]|nr:hypothetical protein [Flavobacteriales bacterium]
MNKYFLVVFTLLIVISSCKLYDPEEIVPSYIYIDDIVVNAKTNEGTSIDNIVDAWVFVNGSQIGVYELPSKIPIHVEGEYTLQIYGGIKKSGSTSVRKRHDFFNPYEVTLNSTPQNLDTITPVIEYESGITIWIEDFEDPGIKFSSLSYSDTNMIITLDPAEVLEGNGSGKITFDASHLLFEAKTSESLFNSFPKFGVPVYLEFDYKSNEVLTTGIYHNNTSTASAKEEYYNLNPTNTWKKAYLELTDIISPQLSATEFDIYFEVVKDKSSLPLVYIDNIKVIF